MLSGLEKMLALMDPGVYEDRKQTLGDVGPWPGRTNAQEFDWREAAPSGTDLVGGMGSGMGLFLSGFLGSDPKMKWKNYFNTETTDMPMYDNMLTNAGYHASKKGRNVSIEIMGPMDYIRNLLKLEGRGTKSIEQELRAVDTTTVGKYTQRAQAGEKMPMPVLDRMYGEQEGRHRAMVAEKLGLRDMPVMVIEDLKKKFGL